MDSEDLVDMIDLRIANSLDRIRDKLKSMHGAELTTVFEETLREEIEWLRA